MRKPTSVKAPKAPRAAKPLKNSLRRVIEKENDLQSDYRDLHIDALKYNKAMSKGRRFGRNKAQKHDTEKWQEHADAISELHHGVAERKATLKDIEHDVPS